ncbi:MAG: hypothetical protein [Microvirus sp.]|nr:MAG: hypothetical protein [Microvirus sp.]
MSRRRSRQRFDSNSRFDAVAVVHDKLASSLRQLRRFDLRLLEDRRLFDPLGDYSRLRSVVGRPRVVVRNVNREAERARKSIFPPVSVGFAVPKNVALCKRRHERREVMHALRLTGRGAGSPKRRGPWSDIHC